MSTTRTFPPHAITDGLTIQPMEFEDLDTGERASFPSMELGDGNVRQAYDLGSGDWTRLQVSFKVLDTSRNLSALLHPEESVDAAISAILSVHCSATMTRFVTPLFRTGDTWHGKITLDRRTLRGVVVVRPLLYRASPEILRPRAGRANFFGALVGEGPSVDLRVDPFTNPFEGGLDVRWEDFRASHDSWRRSHDGDLYAMTFDPEPTVWLNSRHEAIHSLLHDVAATGTAALVKSSVFSVIKEGIWSSLLNAAVHSVERDPETEELVIPGGWQSTTLDVILPHMYPELGSKEARLDELYASLEARTSATEIEVRLRTAVQALSSSADSLSRLVSIAEVSG